MEGIPPQPTGLEPTVQRWNKAKGFADWAEQQPTHCQEGHPYEIGTPAAKVTISWVGCRCENAKRGGGHFVYYCAAGCRDKRWMPECLDPSRQNETNRRG
jgi:hypothetical protein